MSSICNASISDQSWLQATLPCSLGGLGLREASWASPAAFLGCCVSSFALYSQLLSSFSGYSITLSSILSEELAIISLSALLSGTPVPGVPASQLSEAQWIFQSQLVAFQSNSLFPLSHFVIKLLRFMPSLHTLVPVHGSGPFLQFLWALPCPGRSLCVLFGTGLEFPFSLLRILFAAPVAARWTSLETIFLAAAMAQ